ncbi:hypothetical protein HK104_003593 [Borealophlyctis nickersoniae]|nr:hypothetical protein HK104_003593 [Borealophlyctis nickersoniae]
MSTPSLSAQSRSSSAPLLRQASEIANSAIIYEVNLSVPKLKADAYLAYLRTFTKEVCVLKLGYAWADSTGNAINSVASVVVLTTIPRVSGFTGVQVFSQPKPVGLHWLSEEEGEAKAYFTVHYHVESQMHLDVYLAAHQERIAETDQKEWGFLVTSRRILRLQYSTIE